MDAIVLNNFPCAINVPVKFKPSENSKVESQEVVCIKPGLNKIAERLFNLMMRTPQFQELVNAYNAKIICNNSKAIDAYEKEIADILASNPEYQKHITDRGQKQLVEKQASEMANMKNKLEELHQTISELHEKIGKKRGGQHDNASVDKS